MSGHLMCLPPGLPSVYLSDDEMDALNLDAWGNHGWAPEAVASFAKDLRSQLASAREAAEQNVLATHGGRRILEPWMAPLVQRALENNRTARVISRVLPLVEEAAAQGVSLVYDID